MTAKPKLTGATKMIGTQVPEKVWREFRIACLQAERNQNEVLLELIANYAARATSSKKGK